MDLRRLVRIFPLALSLWAQNPLADGQKAFAAGDLARADSQFRQYLKAHPNSAEAWSNLAAVHARREQFGEAIALYQKSLKLNPKLTQVHFNLAVALMRNAQFGEAVPHLRLFLRSHPGEARAHQLLGLCLVETGSLTGAIEELEIALRQNPNDASVRFSLAYAHARAGNTDRSEGILRSVSLPPVQTKLIEATIEQRRERYSEARVKYDEVLALDPRNATALAAMGRLDLLQNNDADAIRYLKQAVELNPQDAESTYQLGVLLDRTGDPQAGTALLRQAIALRPQYADPHYQLGRIALREKRYAEALNEAQAAARLLPEHEAIRLLLARILQAMGRPDDAQKEFDTVRRIKAANIQRQMETVEAERLLKP